MNTLLNTVIGRAASGKSSRILSLLNDYASQGKNCLYIVPEQFSFEAEKLVLENIPAQNSRFIEVISFSHMANKLIEKYDTKHLPYISDIGKQLLMSTVIDDLWDRLAVYGKVKNRQSLVSELLKTDSEFKCSNIDSDILFDLSSETDDKSLSSKLKDIGLILALYNASLTAEYSDKSSAVAHSADILKQTDEYNSYITAVDEFSGFTEDEFLLLEQLMIKSEEMYITFCLDKTDSSSAAYFDLPRESFKQTESIAKKNGVKVSAPVVMSDNYYSTRELIHSENNLFSDEPERFTGENEKSVSVCKCENKFEECEFAAITAKKLVKEYGFRYSDIAVIERTAGEYSKELETAFKRYGISVFIDKKRSIVCAPPVLYALAFLENAFQGLSTDAVLRMLRTGFTEYSQADIDEIDNYALMYNIGDGDWNREWQCNPDGFGNRFTDKSKKKLDRLNNIRASVAASAEKFKSETENLKCGEITVKFYEYLRSVHIEDKLKAFASELSDMGKNEEAELVIDSYNSFIEILSEMYNVIGDKYLSPKRYFELISFAAQKTETGIAPTAIDSVKIGSADRIRLVNTKAVVLVGVNEGVFPVSVSENGIFSDSERKIIRSMGINIQDNIDFSSKRERYIVYRSFSYAREKMFVSFSKKTTDGGALLPSEVVLNFDKIFPREYFSEFNEIQSTDKIASKASAFRFLASEFMNDSSVVTALFSYFSVNGEEERVKSLERLAAKSFPSFKDNAVSAKLYGKNIRLSPSKMEDYYSCKFKYFCKFGLKAVPRKEAGMTANQHGSVIHYVLHRVLDEVGSKGLTATDSKKRKELISKYLKEYSEIFLTGIDSVNNRMGRLFDSYSEIIEIILDRTAKEFARSEFVTVDTELPIDFSEQGLEPYTVECDGGVFVSMTGSVDRVDIYKHSGKNYLRVIDYKTNSKEFKLRDVFDGLNAQMLVYLMCLWRQGGERYGGEIVPAGILYVPAEIGKLELDRNADEYETEQADMKNARMKGLLLNDRAVLTAMGADSDYSTVPVNFDSDGNPTGSVISLEQFTNLHKLIDKKIAEMGSGLIKGDITPLPVFDGKKNICDYCDYKSVCLHTDSDAVFELEYIPEEELFEMLLKGDETDEQ